MQHWCRPGKTSGISASSNFNGNDTLIVFSTNALPLEERSISGSYSKFWAYAHLKFNGDEKEAVRAISDERYENEIKRLKSIFSGEVQNG